MAPKHLHAIAETGNKLVVAYDKHDSVGILDSYFPEASFFTEYERFDRFLEKQRRAGEGQRADYVTICSPNYLHDAHVRLALRIGATAICEKPLVINPWNLDQLADLEQESTGAVHTVLQLRLHPEVQKLRQRVLASQQTHDVCLTYVTRRGRWYQHSWKGDSTKSGGLAMNIGVHFFDFLLWIFGDVQRCDVHLDQPSRVAGVLELERAKVRWFLSIDRDDLPSSVIQNGGFAHRSITVDDEQIDLSKGFADLHTEVYRTILGGNGFGISDARPSIELIYRIRQCEPTSASADGHPFLRGNAAQVTK